MTYRYFNRYVRIKYACGHRKIGTDTLREFVTAYKVKCPECLTNTLKKCRGCGVLFSSLNEDGLCDLCELEKEV